MEVFSAQGRDPVAKWKLLGPVKREYDRHVKGYVYSMEGGSSTTTRMQLPRNEKAQCKLLAPLLWGWAVFRVMWSAFLPSGSGAAVLCVPAAGSL